MLVVIVNIYTCTGIFLGPIDNSDFLCAHGGVLPMKVPVVYDLCVSLPQSVWDLLHKRFGGGPACTRLYECVQCRRELDALNKQKIYELEEFKRLHSEFLVRKRINMNMS